MQLTDWLLVEVALLLIGLTKIFFVKTGFDRLGGINRLLDYQLWCEIVSTCIRRTC
jgi:hypothetical protein